MGKPSTIATHPEQVAIDAAILANHESLASLAVRFNVSVHGLSRRKKALATAPATEASDRDDLQARSDLLWERSNQVWEASLVDADTKNQIASIQAGLRSLELAHKRAEKTADAASEAKNDGDFTLEEIDAMVKRFEKMQQEQGREKALEAAENSRRLDLPNCMGIFFACAEDPKLRELIAVTARDYQNARDGWKGTVDATIQETHATS